VELARSRWICTSSEEAATTRDSRGIDAAVMAHDRAAALAGTVRDNSYI
jgi:hypothetical protein